MRKLTPALVSLTLSCPIWSCPTWLAAQQATPEAPAIWREVTGVIDETMPSNPRFTRPHIPALRTTADGRIGLIVEGGPGGTQGEGGTPRFALFIPEKLTAPVPLSGAQPYGPDTANSHTILSPTWRWLNFQAGVTLNASLAEFTKRGFTPSGDPVSHACLWDASPPTGSDDGTDVYEIQVFVSSNTGNGQTAPRRTRFYVTPITIVVSNAKSTAAAITSITRTNDASGQPLPTLYSSIISFTPIGGTPIELEASAFEPVIAGDGRLLVVRLACPHFAWIDPENATIQHPPSGVVNQAQAIDIAYSYYPTGPVADPAQWQHLVPITHAPFDTRINGKFGFAMAPFRDPEGTLIPDGEDIAGSYPWIDRDARNLFFEAVNDLLKQPSGTMRYPNVGVFNDPWYATGFAEDSGLHQGISLVGLWSHGKIVQIDNLNNDVDYAVGSGDGAVGPQQRMVTLYQAGTGSQGNEPAELRLGYGRSTVRMPKGENDNGNIIDSLENRFNYRRHAAPLTLRDVIWPLSNCKQVDEIVFDDYIDPGAFIVANMVGLMTFPPNPGGSLGYNVMTHHSGWNGSGFTLSVKLQNAATGLGWALPTHGLVVNGNPNGRGRLEPAAAGGVHGKGLWLTGDNGLQFTVPVQAPATKIYGHDWYVGVFVDCRYDDDDASERRLLTFPDGTSIRLYARRQVLYADAAGSIVQRITLPPVVTSQPANPLDDLLPRTGWAHLGFQIRRAGKDVEFLLDGLPYARFQDFASALFQMPAGNLTVGRPSGTSLLGFRGWIDDLKVFTHALDPETACNHAGGTLVGLPANYTGPWKTLFADRIPAWAHAKISATLRNGGNAAHAAYACFHHYVGDNGVHRDSIPNGTVHVRQQVLFPEGPLFHDKPRPDTSRNGFCLSCHEAQGAGGLGLGALVYNGRANAAADPRRQPSQPPARIHGFIPAGLVDSTNLPTAATTTAPSGQFIDAWLLPTFSGTPTVETFTLVDGNTGTDLAQLQANDTVDPARHGTNKFQIRANLSTSQGTVALTFRKIGQMAVMLVQRTHGQYTLFGGQNDPLAGSVFAPGTYEVTAQPKGGVTVAVQFTVPGGAPRAVADFRDDFVAGSPATNWVYRWNATGALLDPLGQPTGPWGYRNLNWLPGSGRYTELGLVFPEATPFCPFGSFDANGGHPGRGANQGASFDRFVIAGFAVQWDGHYKVDNGFVQSTNPNPGGNGGQVVIYAQVGSGYALAMNSTFAAGQTLNLTGMPSMNLSKGDVIWLGVGPNLVDSFDSFALDYSILFNEAAF